MVVQAVAPALRGPTLSAQRWRDLTFLHWPVDVDLAARWMPPGVRPDEFDGRTYVGLVPFSMRGAGPYRLPVRYFGDFAETNVRLYSVDDAGRSGVVFATLDATRLATVLLARVGLGLPYAWSRMSTTPVGHYRSRRRWPRADADTDVVVRVGEPVEPTPLETWLTARWGLHTRLAGRTRWIPNRHESWPLHAAELLRLDETLLAACHLAPAGDMLRPLFSPGVRTTFGLPTTVG